MVVYVSITVGGTAYTDHEDITVNNSISENNGSSHFSASFPNHNGEHDDDFTIGAVVVIKAEKDDTTPDDTVFNGIVEDIDYREKEQVSTITISGRDQTAKLMDATIIPVVYNNTEVSLIVKDIIDDNVSGITYVNVNVTPTTITHVAFNHMTVYDALKYLAEVSGFFFYIDNTADLHFELKGSSSSGQTLNNTNVVSSRFRTTDKELYNSVWVYGGQTLTKYRDPFTADGGSVYTLNYKPHNTEVLVGGSTQPKVGGIFDLITTTPGSPTQYLVDFDQKKIVFVSGTGNDNIPVSGTDAINVKYDRGITIVKYASDRGSIAAYGKKEKVIVDKNIVDPQMAKDIAKNTLDRYKEPLKQGTLNMQDLITLTAGNTVLVNLPNENIDNVLFDIIEVQYTFNAQTNLANEVMRVKVSRRITDITDTIKQMMLDIKKLQAEDSLTAEILTRLELATGSYGFRVSSFYVRTRTMGSSFVLGNPLLGDLGSGTDQANPQSYLGDSRGAQVVEVSGGTWT